MLFLKTIAIKKICFIIKIIFKIILLHIGDSFAQRSNDCKHFKRHL